MLNPYSKIMDSHLYFPLLLIFHIFVYHKVAAALDAKTDRQALLSLKFEIADPKNSLSNWNTTTSHCIWSGVSCTATNRVRSLNLTGFGLLGTLSPHLSNLTSLQIINLSKNSFYGQIPPGFAQLSRLEHFILSENSLTGTIPSTLSQCHNLRVVSLSFNNLTGHLPPELGSLTRLKVLNASGNNLTGVIPPTFGNLSALSVLSLSRNQLYGTIPDKLGDHLRSLLTIQLSENQLSGEFPHSVLNISSLLYLSVTQNNFTGKLPDDLGFSLPNIEKLYLAQNRFRGPIPDSLSNASRIQDLDLSSNQFQGPILSLTNMDKLVNLNLGGNSLSSTTELNFQLFESLKNCTKLQSLILNSNQLAGELPISLANLSANLTHFCVDSNYFTGNFPRGIGNYQNLISVAIQQNFFSGQIPRSIGALHKLQRMTLQANMFSGEIPDVFANLTRLYLLTLGSNQFSGKIPLSIGRCHSLGTLGLANNNLVGGVPKEIFGLYDLNFLNLARNALNDSLPSELGSLKQLEFFAVSENHLSGDLLKTIHSCVSMRNLNASRNNFSGSIPKSVGDLIALESLDLSSNNFSGPIPEELENLRVLQELNVSFNDLEGQIPRNGVFINLGWDSFVGNSKLCGYDQEDATRLRIPNCIVKKKKSVHLAPKTIIIIVISSVVVICAVFGLIWAFFSWRMKRKMQRGRDISSPSLKGLPPKISYSDIHQATNDFSADNLIGKGSFGSVYKGVFGIGESGVYTTLAVKVLDLNQSRALKSFNAECEALRNVRHRNLVRIITSCSSIDHGGGEFKALVMELMSNGSLENWVHPKEFESGSNLSLTQRLDIAIDVASAMDYLHHDCEPPVVHCDLKPSNVLLDDNMRAHVGDFGLARFLHPVLTENNSSTMGLKGSIGYIAPEYGLGSNVSTKGDVYSFGILLLEIFTARKPTDEMFKDGLNLYKFVSEVMLQQNQVLKMVDAIRHFNSNDYSSEDNTATRISSSFVGYSSGEISIAATNWDSKIERCVAALMRVGLCCAADSPGERLTMRETLTKLHEIKRNLLE